MQGEPLLADVSASKVSRCCDWLESSMGKVSGLRQWFHCLLFCSYPNSEYGGDWSKYLPELEPAEFVDWLEVKDSHLERILFEPLQMFLFPGRFDPRTGEVISRLDAAGGKAAEEGWCMVHIEGETYSEKLKIVVLKLQQVVLKLQQVVLKL